MDDREHSKGLARMRRGAWIVLALISLAGLIPVCGMWVRAYPARPARSPADTVLTTPDDATRYLAALTILFALVAITFWCFANSEPGAPVSKEPTRSRA